MTLDIHKLIIDTITDVFNNRMDPVLNVISEYYGFYEDTKSIVQFLFEHIGEFYFYKATIPREKYNYVLDHSDFSMHVKAPWCDSEIVIDAFGNVTFGGVIQHASAFTLSPHYPFVCKDDDNSYQVNIEADKQKITKVNRAANKSSKYYPYKLDSIIGNVFDGRIHFPDVCIHTGVMTHFNGPTEFFVCNK